MLDKLDTALHFNQEALNLRVQRQEILVATNIANAALRDIRRGISVSPAS